MNLLEGKVAIVTGGSRGIGRGIVRSFVDHGAQVITGDIREEAGREAVEDMNADVDGPGQAHFRPVDVAEQDDLEKLVDAAREQGPPTILVNNAANVQFYQVQEADEQSVKDSLQVNVMGAWKLARLVLPAMKDAEQGSIINLGSTHPMQTRPGSFPYNMTKGAILAMNKAMAVDFGPHNVRVNALLPGIVDTPLCREWLSEFDDPEQKRNEIIQNHCLPDIPSMEEVAETIVFLASDLSTGISGADVIVDAGREIKR